MDNKAEYFKNIYQEVSAKVYRLCLGYTGNREDAEDLFQDIMILIWNNLHTFRNESSVNTWIFRIAVNRALLYVKRRSREEKLVQTLYQSNHQKIELSEEIASKEDKEEIINFLYARIAELEELDRIIISMILEGCSYKEISDVLGINISNVGVRINRIKNKLKNKFESHGRFYQ